MIPSHYFVQLAVSKADQYTAVCANVLIEQELNYVAIFDNFLVSIQLQSQWTDEEHKRPLVCFVPTMSHGQQQHMRHFHVATHESRQFTRSVVKRNREPKDAR